MATLSRNVGLVFWGVFFGFFAVLIFAVSLSISESELVQTRAKLLL